MPRFTPSGPRDTAPVQGGDLSFRGVVEKGEPEQLPAGALQELVNGTCRDGTIRTRLGSQTPMSLRMTTGAAVVFGSGVFSDPFGVEWLLLATAAGVWRVRDGYTPRLIEIPEALAASCRIVQAFRTVLLFRGAEAAPWQWDGEQTHAFEPISQASDGSTSPIPNGPDRAGLMPIVMQNRLIIPHGRASIAVSDILDYTNYDPVFASFNLTGGTDDNLTALFRYTQSELLVFNDQSLQLLAGIEPTLTSLSLSPLNDSLGCVAGGTVARLGNDVLWLGDNAVWTLREVEQRRETAPVPLSDPIERSMQRIAWRHATPAVAAVHEECYYLAVPWEEATSNNVLLPYDSARQAWMGRHEFPTGVRFDALHRLDWFGRKRLHGVDYATGRVHLLYEGRHDYVADTRNDIALQATTRAYLLEIPERKRFRRGRIYHKSWAPTITATLQTDGVNEEVTLASAMTRDRRKYTVFGRADYTVTNANDDHAAPFRRDYSPILDDPGLNPNTSGIDPDLEQHHTLPFTLRARGRHAAIEIRNTTGTLAVTGVLLEGMPSEKADRPTV